MKFCVDTANKVTCSAHPPTLFQHCQHVSLEQVENIPCINSVSPLRLLI